MDQGLRIMDQGSWIKDHGLKIMNQGSLNNLRWKLHLDQYSHSTCKAGDIGCISRQLLHHSCSSLTANSFSMILDTTVVFFFSSSAKLLFLKYITFGSFCLCSCSYFRYWWFEMNRGEQTSRHTIPAGLLPLVNTYIQLELQIGTQLYIQIWLQIQTQMWIQT